MRRSIHAVLALLAFGLSLAMAAGCGDGPSSPGFGTMRVRMTDATGDFDEVNLVITEVSVRRDGDASGSESRSTDEEGWIVLSSGPATYDLLDLRNGVFTTIGQGSLPAGPYTQVRLKIGTAGSVQGVLVGGWLRDADVVACVRERARSWHFPGPAGGCAVISAPFSLTPRQ